MALTDTKFVPSGHRFDIDVDNSSGLSLRVRGGVLLDGLGYKSVANATLTLTASTTNYVEMDDAGVISTNASAFTSGYSSLYEVATNATAVTGIKDWRSSPELDPTLDLGTAKSITAAMVALADGKIFAGDAGGAAAAVTPSGDITMTNLGVTAIGADKVTAAQLAVAVRTTFLNGIRSYLADGMAAIATITVSAVTAVKFKTTTTAIFRLAGVHYSKVAEDVIVFSAADTINTAAGAGTLWGIWLVQSTSAGVVSTKPGASDMTYASEAAAIAALPAVDADNVQLGYITVQGLEATDWVANTDNLTVGGGAGNCTARSFYDLPAPVALPSAL